MSLKSVCTPYDDVARVAIEDTAFLMNAIVNNPTKEIPVALTIEEKIAAQAAIVQLVESVREKYCGRQKELEPFVMFYVTAAIVELISVNKSLTPTPAPALQGLEQVAPVVKKVIKRVLKCNCDLARQFFLDFAITLDPTVVSTYPKTVVELLQLLVDLQLNSPLLRLCKKAE